MWFNIKVYTLEIITDWLYDYELLDLIKCVQKKQTLIGRSRWEVIWAIRRSSIPTD